MWKISLLAAPLVVLGAGAAQAQRADVVHWWTSGGESKAVGQLAQAYDAAGGQWVDNAVVGGSAARASAMSRIAGGNPPVAMQWNLGLTTKQLAEQGLLRPLDAIAKSGDWSQKFAPFVYKNLVEGGHVYGIPVTMSGTNWLYYSTKIFSDLKLQPPATWDAFFAVADKIKAAGLIPVAIGAQPWQLELVFQAVVLGVGGPDYYRTVFSAHDTKAAGDATMVKSFDVMRHLSTYADEGSSNRKWNDTTLLVEQNKAGMQIMGEWAQAEFQSAGLKIGQNFGCALTPSSGDNFIVSIDAFVLPKGPAANDAAGDKLATVVASPVEQVAFADLKGSLPTRTDADTSGMDACAQIGAKILKDHPGNLLPNAQLSFGSDDEGMFADLLAQFWNTPSMTSAEATKQFATVVGSAQPVQ